MNPTEGGSSFKPEAIAPVQPSPVETPVVSPVAQLGAEADNVFKTVGASEAIDTVAGIPLDTKATASSGPEGRPIGFDTSPRAMATDATGEESSDEKATPDVGKATTDTSPAEEPPTEEKTEDPKEDKTTDPKETAAPSPVDKDKGKSEAFVSDNKKATLVDKINTSNDYLKDLNRKKEELQNTPLDQITIPNENPSFPATESQRETYRQQELERMNQEIIQAKDQLKELKATRDPQREKELKDKIQEGNATPEDLEEFDILTHEGREPDPQQVREQEFKDLAEKIIAGDATEQDKLRYDDLREQRNREKVSDLSQPWIEKAARGENPADELVTYLNKFNELNGDTPLTEAEVKDLKGFLKEVYDGDITSVDFEKSRIRDKFVELGQIEARVIALKEVLKSMKNSEKKMKAETHVAEEQYLSATDPQDRMQKLAVWRQKAIQLEGYQMAINDQASRGRDENIKRRIAAGYIHRKLGTRGLGGNIAFGIKTLGYEVSDAFQDVTIDQFKDRYN